MFGRIKIQTSSSDEQLMAAVCKGHRPAFELLYERYFDRLTRFALRFLCDRQKAEDAVQEVFIRIIDKPESFDSARKFSTWVYTLVGNSCRNILRNEGTRARLDGEQVITRAGEAAEMHPGYDLSVLRRCLATAYDELNEKEKWIYVLRFEENLSIREIAEVTSLPEGSIKSGIYYMLKKIGKHLKEFNYG